MQISTAAPVKSTGEPLIVILLLIVILGVNLLTAVRYPNVWSDEVMYADPGVNLAMGKGFVSSSWYAQTGDRFFAGNTPLHSLVVAGWTRAFGFSIVSIRAIDYAWFVLGTFSLWQFSIRRQWIKTTGWRLAIIVLLACDAMIAFSYRGGRPDMIGFFLGALSLYVATVANPMVRVPALLMLGILFPWAGLQLLPWLMLITLLIFLFYGWRPALNGIVVGTGAAAGLVALYFFYWHNGVWTDFLASIRTHTTGTVHRHWAATDLPHLFLQDYSVPFIMLLVAWLAVRARNSGDPAAFKDALFGLACSIAIPAGIRLAGVFPVYYEWMAAVPLILATGAAASRLPAPGYVGRYLTMALCAGAIAVGLPCRLAVSAICSDTGDYSASEKFVSTNLTAADFAYADYTAYYPVQRTAARTMTLRYLEVMTPAERTNVTALVIDPRKFAFATNALPGDWQKVAEFDHHSTTGHLPPFLWRSFHNQPTTAPYDLAVYRKIPDNSQK